MMSNTFPAKTRITLLAAMILLLSVVSMCAETPVVAVFDTEPVEGDPRLGDIIYHEIEQAMAATGKFQLVDRRNRQAVLAEQKLALDDLLHSSQLFRFGQLVNADYIMLSSAVLRGESLYIYLKLIDVATGETLYPQSVTLSREEDAVTAGVRQAVEGVASHFETSGEALKVSDDVVTVSLGYRNQVKVGDELFVYRRGEMVVDPLTYQVVGYERRRVGKLRVTDVQGASLLQAEIVVGRDIQRGDEVTLVTEQSGALRAGQPTRGVPPAQLSASELLLRTRPDRADVYLDNHYVGQTHQHEPLSALIQAGRHVLRIERKDHQTVRKVIETAPGDRILNDIRLLPLEGYLYITSSPAGAEVYLNDQYEGLTPVRISRQKAGSFTLHLKRHGYKPARKRVKIRLEESTDVHFDLKALADKTPELAPPGMVYVPGGRFVMGRDDGAEDEQPEHPVEVGALYVDRHEVMVKEFQQFCEITGYPMPALPVWVQDNHPMTNVTWADAAAYADWLGKRLPTEAEWEYLAREQGERVDWNDAEQRRDAMNIAGVEREDEWPRTAPVGSFGASDLGILDMQGNVYEWCGDWYNSRYYSRSSLRNPRGEGFGGRRVIRGGCWAFGLDAASPYARAFANPSNRSDIIGFRCVREAD